MKYETQRLMFSSQSGKWKTPQDLFNQLDQEFDFTTDVCAEIGYKMKESMQQLYFHSLTNPWKLFLNRNVCWMNPPYGREISKWLAKASLEAITNQVTTVALLPARTDTKWFWNYCSWREIRFLKGRLHFSNKGPAPFPSMIVVFKP